MLGPSLTCFLWETHSVGILLLHTDPVAMLPAGFLGMPEHVLYV